MKVVSGSCKKCGHWETHLEWCAVAMPMEAGHLEAICNNCDYRWPVKALDEVGE